MTKVRICIRCSDRPVGRWRFCNCTEYRWGEASEIVCDGGHIQGETLSDGRELGSDAGPSIMNDMCDPCQREWWDSK